MTSTNTVLNRLREPAKRLIPLRLRAPLNRTYFALISLFYRGGDRWCPCCRHAVKRFLPYATYGHEPTPNAQCPVCGCLARHRLIWQFLTVTGRLAEAPLRLLHFAPEPILQRQLRQVPGIDYVSADIESPLAMVRMDIMDIDRPDSSFDAIVCSHVLAHVPDDRKAIAEMLRVLRPGGWALIQTSVDEDRPTFEDPAARTVEERVAAYGQVDLWRHYGTDLSDRLAAAGFEVTAVRRDDVADRHSADEMGFDDVPLYLCVRPP